MRRVVAIGDLHFPFGDAKNIRKVIEAVRRLKPDIVIQMGDLYDCYSWARWPRSQNIYTPKDEITIARRLAQEFWSDIKAASSKSEKIQLTGNHDDRPMKKVLSAYPEIEAFLDVKHFWEFPGVKLEHDGEFVLDGVVYMHGFLSRPGDHARFCLKSVVRGHSHHGGTTFINQEGRVIWELDCGYLAKRQAAPLSYGPLKKFTKWTQGYGVIDADGPRFCPLPG